MSAWETPSFGRACPGSADHRVAIEDWLDLAQQPLWFGDALCREYPDRGLGAEVVSLLSALKKETA
jgi:hypothetical protein